MNVKAPQGPWDAPLRNYVKSFPMVVTIYDLKGNLIKEEKIDYGSYECRKFLGRITYWACSNHYVVEACSQEDYDKQ